VYQDWTPIDYSQSADCDMGDMDAYLPDVIDMSMGSMFTAAREQIGLPAESLQESEFTCAKYAHFCDVEEARFLRTLCSRTCGCRDPSNGLFFVQSAAGCPANCAEPYKAIVAAEPCEDKDVVGTEVWEQLVGSYVRKMTVYYREDPSVYDHWGAGLLAGGCGALAPDPVALQAGFVVYPCDETEQDSVQEGIASFMFFCPRACCKYAAKQLGTTFPRCPDACAGE